MKIAIVLGTRSEFIKLAPLITLCEMKGLEYQAFLSGQHRDLLNGLFELFGIKKFESLKLELPSQPSLSELTGALMKAVDEQILAKGGWDAVVVQGDTVTALAAAMAAFYRKIPVAHIEAGLRTFDISKPFPEEMNRQVITKLAHWHFCPTPRAKSNLLREGVSPAQIELCGNTAIDSLLYILKYKLTPNYAVTDLPKESPELVEALNKYTETGGQSLSLFTLHRRENIDQGLTPFFSALRQWLEKHPDHHMLFPYHPNPLIKNAAISCFGGLSNLHLIPPLGYRAMLFAISRADFVLSDSGGLQEEVPTFKKPLLVLRDVTERPEILEKGLAKAIGLNPQVVIDECDSLLQALKNSRLPSWYKPAQNNPFGDGFSAQRILQRLQTDLGSSVTPQLAS